ncbi:hypothetical protein [Beijerinckia sp. L45]|uniref:hypothetical protein n=1 Tax=Beijerinckia sp. L45 TaxID=1641855 RepID=UPI00131B6CFB|nr:hypothetical protein [Beijerinckia sp. L45]
MKTSILIAAAALSLGAISPVLAQSSYVERSAPAYEARVNDGVVTGRSAYVDNASQADRQSATGFKNTIGNHGFYGQ